MFAIVIRHLPPTISLVLLSGLKYVRMGGTFLDDVAGAIVGLGFVVWVSRWITKQY